jgi:hypothetical protein
MQALPKEKRRKHAPRNQKQIRTKNRRALQYGLRSFTERVSFFVHDPAPWGKRRPNTGMMMLTVLLYSVIFAIWKDEGCSMR